MIQKKGRTHAITIDLDGPQGNAHVILGVCQNIAKQCGYCMRCSNKEGVIGRCGQPKESHWSVIREEMTSGDYYNLVRTADSYFGRFISFETENEDLLAILSEE